MNPAQLSALRALSRKETLEFWDKAEKIGEKNGDFIQVVRNLCLADLYYLLVRVCGRKDMLNDFAFERCREVEANPDNYLDLWAREHFKDLADDTPMLTANRGWTTHGQLEVGDKVFSPEGKEISVIALSERYTTSKCYRITFHDKSEIVAGAGHLWKLRVKHKLRIANSEDRLVTFTEQIVTTENLSRSTRCDVGVSEPLERPVAQLPIDPYVFGAWLGDGTSSNAMITCAYSDIEIIERIRVKGVSADERKSSNQNTGSYRLDCGIQGKKGAGMTGLLRRLGILNNKHIPDIYMNASIYQRMELLRGLMDTDGTCNDRGTATFANANEQLANQVYDLAAGLGLRPRIAGRSFKSDAKKTKDGRYYFWQVSFQAHKDSNPFALKRKADRAIESYLHRDTRLVRGIEQIPSVPTRCIQVEGGMYLAGRELIPTHNSSIITFGLTIQDILKDPEVTFGLFSHTRPIAKAFLRQIMREFESNKVLHAAFPDILWGSDIRAAPKWSEDDGIIVKRKTNPKEATVEAWGLVDGQPTSKHYKKLLYDDIVVQGSVSNPEMIQKTMTALEQSYNLGVATHLCRRFVGTRWHFSDAYRTIKDRGTAIPREHPGRIGGTEEGESVFWSDEIHLQKRRDMGPYTYAAQILLNPKADAMQGFKREWLNKYKKLSPEKLNWYLLVDAASSKKKGSDYTSIWAVGLGVDNNYYCIPVVRDRLNLKERSDALFAAHREYKPKEPVRYEKYGLMSDIEHMQSRMEQENYRFKIQEVGGQTSKADRIKRLLPLFEAGRIWIPESRYVTDWQKVPVDLINSFIEEEYMAFPVGLHDDMLDALARIAEPDFPLVWPKEKKKDAYVPPTYNLNPQTAWMV